MADAPISQEIRLPTNTEEVGKAVAKLDEMLARIGKLEHAGEKHHEETKKTEGAFHKLFDAMGKVVKREVELAAGIRSVGAAGLEAKNKVGEFLEFIGAVAALELLKKIGEKIVDIGEESLNAAAHAERMNFAIDAATGGKAAGEATRKWIEDYSKHSIFSEHENLSAFLDLKHFGLGQKSAALALKASEDLATMTDPDKAGAVRESALMALEEAHRRGTVSGRSLRGLGIGVDALRTMPQFAGVKDNRKLMEAVERANFSENDLYNLVIKQTGEKGLGQRGADASESLLSRWERLIKLPDRFYERLGDTKAVKVLSGALGDALEVLDPDSPAGKKIFGGLESIFTTIADTVGEIDFDEVADSIRSDVIPAIKGLVGLITPMVDTFERLFRGAHRLHDMIVGDHQTRSKAMEEAGLNPVQRTVEGNLPAIKKFVYGVPFLGPMAKKYDDAAAARAAGQTVGEGFGEGIKASTGKAGEAASGLGEEGLSSLNESIDAHSPSRKAKRSGHFVGEGFALGIEGSSDRIADAMDSTIGIPMPRGATSISGIHGAAGVTVSFGDINVTIAGGHGNAEDAGEIVDEIRKSLRPMFIDLLDEMDGEG